MSNISFEEEEKLKNRVDNAIHSMVHDENASLIEVIEELGDIIKEIIKALRK